MYHQIIVFPFCLTDFDNTLTDPLWLLVPDHRDMTQVMQKGGITLSSESNYYKGFCEYVRTMERLYIPEELIYTFPTPSVLIKIYITDCAIMRAKPNTYDTIRGKLRGIDFVAQCMNIHQSWSDNPLLAGQIKYCKKQCKGTGSDTVPITIDKMRIIINWIICTKVINDLILTPYEKSRIDHWRLFPRIIADIDRLNAYWYAMSLMLNVTLGLRGAEQYENTNKVYAGYGIQLKDITFMWRDPDTNQVFPYNDYTMHTDRLEHIQFRLRHTKCGNINDEIFVRMGRAYGDIDPALIIYEMYHTMIDQFQSIHVQSVSANSFFCSGIDRKWTLKSVKNEWHLNIYAMHQWLEPTKMRFHGLRKGFATSLQKKSVPLGLIAFAGRWTLQAAIYRYILWEQDDLIGLANILWNKPETVFIPSVDMEASELALLQALPPSVHQYLNDYAKNRL